MNPIQQNPQAGGSQDLSGMQGGIPTGATTQENVIVALAQQIDSIKQVLQGVVGKELMAGKQQLQELSTRLDFLRTEVMDAKNSISPVVGQTNAMSKMVNAKLENNDLKLENFVQKTLADRFGQGIRTDAFGRVIDNKLQEHSNKMKSYVSDRMDEEKVSDMRSDLDKMQSQLKTLSSDDNFNKRVDNLRGEVKKMAIDSVTAKDIADKVNKERDILQVSSIKGLTGVITEMTARNVSQPITVDVYNGSVLLKSGVSKISTTGATYSNGVVTMGGGAGAVTSVFGRTGTVAATSGDYTAAQITNVPAGNISATNVQAALNELDTEVVHLAGTETITGNKTFTGTVTVPTPVANTDASTKAYADSLVLGLWDDRGSYDASVNSYPATGGSGTAGAVLKGDIWTISVPGILGGVSVSVGDTVRAVIDTPGQVAANWATLEGNLGYTPVTNARTINTLPLSADQTFATGTTGTDFNIVSAGTVHTYNIPSASATARGLVSIVAQSFASVKTFIASTIFSTGSQYTVTTTFSPGATPSLNFATTAIQNLTLSTSITSITFTAPTLTAGNYARLQIRMNTGLGGFTVAGWPANVKWSGGTAPTITNTTNKTDIITMVYDGSFYFATVSQNF